MPLTLEGLPSEVRVARIFFASRSGCLGKFSGGKGLNSRDFIRNIQTCENIAIHFRFDWKANDPEGGYLLLFSFSFPGTFGAFTFR